MKNGSGIQSRTDADKYEAKTVQKGDAGMLNDQTYICFEHAK